jgi:predicted ribosome quality control (RQC) complex YloA/Tae2 family protein
MALTATEIELVLAEIAPPLDNARIQKIHQPGDRVLLFELRVPSETHRLLISCEPESARLHLTTRLLPNPPRPPSFCQFLRAQVQGGRLEDVRQLGHDRIVALTVSTRQGPRSLVCALTGRTANVLLLDEQRHVLRDLNGQRHLIGQPYQEPPQRESRSTPERAPRFDPQTPGERFPISQAIEVYYHDKERASLADRAKHDRLRMLRKSLSKMLRRIDAWREDLAKAAAYRDYGRYGELLKAQLASMTPGMEQIRLVDYYDPALPEVTLPLDRAKSALHNMNDYFKKHRRYLTADRELHARIASGEQEADVLRREITSIEDGSWTPPTARPPREPQKRASNRGRPAGIRQGPFRRFVSADGLPIFVGRNAAENEDLTFRMAKSDDLWLHARGTPGSHVVVRLAKGADPPLETLREAATLALLYSDLKQSGKGDVIYTKRKWVKKVKGQARGAVVVTQEKTISVRLDPLRLAALKERSHSSSTA